MVVQRAMHRHNVRCGKQLVERQARVFLAARHTRSGRICHLASESSSQTRNLMTYITQTDDTPAAAAQLCRRTVEVEDTVRRRITPRLEISVIIYRFAQQGQSSPQRRLRNGVCRVSHGIAHFDSTVGRSRQIHVVHAGSRHTDKFQMRQAGHRRSVDNDLVCYHYVGIGTTLRNLVGRRHIISLVFTESAEGLHTASTHRIFIQKDNFHDICLYFTFSKLTDKSAHHNRRTPDAEHGGYVGYGSHI